MISIEAFSDELEKISSINSLARSGRRPIGIDKLLSKLSAKMPSKKVLALGGAAVGGYIGGKKLEQAKDDYQLGRQIRNQQQQGQ